jgi:hypothetical protein
VQAASQAQPALLVPQVLQAQPVHRAQPGPQDRKGHVGHKDPQAPQAPSDRKGHKDHKDPAAPLEL